MARTRPKRRGNERRSSEFRFRASFERLEERRLLTIVFDPVFGSETQIQNFNAVEANPPVYLIFWGAEWQSGNGPAQENQLNLAAQALIYSPFLQATAQYGTGGTATFGGAVTNFAPVVTFNDDDLRTLDVHEVQFGGLPNGNTVTPTPLFVVVTRPGVMSDDYGTKAVGYNTSLRYDGVDYPTIWCSSNFDFSVPPTGAVNVDNFTKALSHELAECMTDLGGGGFEVNPGPTWVDDGDTGHQICDYEPSGYQYREPDGALVQPVWSRADNTIIVADGNAQQFLLRAADNTWLNDSTDQQYDLEINGDQAGHSDDAIYIDSLGSVGGDFVKVTLNGEVAVFEPGSIRSIRVNTLGGANTVTIARTSVPVTIYDNDNDAINFGVGGSVQGITADVSLSNSDAAIHVDDSTDPTPLTPTIGAGYIKNLLPGGRVLSFSISNHENVTLNTGSGAGTIVVEGTIFGGLVTVNSAQGTSAIKVEKVDYGGPLVVNLGGGTQAVNISSKDRNYSSSVFADVTVHPGTGISTLNIDDDSATASRRWTINAGSISSDVVGAGVIHYGRVDTVNLFGGNEGNTFFVENTLNGLTTSLWTNISDEVIVLGTGLLSTLNVNGYAREINVGNAGRTADIHGLVYVDVIVGDLFVDDSADLLGNNDVVVTATSIVGLSDGSIGFYSSGLHALAIFGSQGGSTYHVLGTPTDPTATTTLTCEGADVVDIGSNGSLAGIQSNLFIQNPANFTNVTIDASANASPSTPATITNAAVTGLSVGAIEFDQSALSALNIYGPQGGTTYDVLSLPAYFLLPIITTLNARSGDTVNIGQHGSLQAPWANASLVCDFAAGLAAPSRLLLDGSLDPAGAAYAIAGDNSLTVTNSTVGLRVTINGFRSQDEAVIDLPGGSVDADFTHTSAGTIVVDGSLRLTGVDVSAPLDVTAHARAGAIVMQPAGANASLLRMFNTLDLLGTRPQDSVDVYDSDNSLAFSNDAIPAPYAQFAATPDDPTTVTAGQPFDFAVVAEDAQRAPLSAYDSQVQWYAYNRATGEYVESEYESFLPLEQGQHLFQGIVLSDAGTYSLGFDDGWNVSSFTINVLASPQGGLHVEPVGDTGTPNIAAANSDVAPAADANAAVASAPPDEVSGPTLAVEGEPTTIVFLDQNSATVTTGASNRVETAPRQTTAAIDIRGDRSGSGPLVMETSNDQTGRLSVPRTEPAQPRDPFTTVVSRQPLADIRTMAASCEVDPRMNPSEPRGPDAFRSTQPVVVVHSSTDSAATPLPNPASSESIGGARAEPGEVHLAIVSSIAMIRSDAALALPIASLWTDAVDECFAQYDGLATFFNHDG